MCVHEPVELREILLIFVFVSYLAGENDVINFTNNSSSVFVAFKWRTRRRKLMSLERNAKKVFHLIFTISPTAINLTMLKCVPLRAYVRFLATICHFMNEKSNPENTDPNTIWHFEMISARLIGRVRMVYLHLGHIPILFCLFISSFKIGQKKMENEKYRKQQKEQAIYVYLSVVGSVLPYVLFFWIGLDIHIY